VNLPYSLPVLAMAVIIVICLAFYAGRLLFLLNLQTKRQQQVRLVRIESIIQSIQTIAAATEQGQCNISEASIRICRLIAALPVKEIVDYNSAFPAIHELTNRIEDLATHESRKELSKSERKGQDKIREQHEAELRDEVFKEVKKLKLFEL
jgi:hypothetical protein